MSFICQAALTLCRFTANRAAFLLLASLVAAALGHASGATVDTRTSPRTFRVVELSGTPYQRGLKHGTQLRDRIHAGVAIWKEDLQTTYHTNADQFIKEFLAKTDYVPAINKWTPGLLDEVRGIAEGSGMDFPTMLTFQLIDEYWVNGGEILREHCSGLGIARSADHSALVAQNLDVEGFRDGFQTLLHIKEPSGLEEYVLTMPGLIAMNGMNNQGVGITANTLSQLTHARNGLPVAFVIRGVLQRNTFDEVASFLKGARHASGQNYLVGASGRVGYFETSAAKVSAIEGKAGFIFHTNHPLSNTDYSVDGARYMSQPNLSDSTHARYAALKQRLSADPGKTAVELIKQTLRSKDSESNPVCRRFKDKRSGFTYASAIMVLSGQQPCLIAAPGPPDQYEYATFRFSEPNSAK